MAERMALKAHSSATGKSNTLSPMSSTKRCSRLNAFLVTSKSQSRSPSTKSHRYTTRRVRLWGSSVASHATRPSASLRSAPFLSGGEAKRGCKRGFIGQVSEPVSLRTQLKVKNTRGIFR
eukprot:2329943-Pyramimonas_sp.AAC.1